MKIRNGFVSNSSSSSFIIPLTNIPSSVEELRREMYGDLSEIEYMYNWGDQKTILNTMSLAEIVYNDITRAYNAPPPVDDDDDPLWVDDEVVDEKNRMMEMYPQRKIIEISYSDNDGKYFTELEHSGIIESTFDGAVKISQH